MRPDPLEPVENQFQPTIRMARAAFDAAINEFDGAPRYPVDEMRKAVSLAPAVPAISIDPRERNLAKQALIAIAEYAAQQLSAVRHYWLAVKLLQGVILVC